MKKILLVTFSAILMIGCGGDYTIKVTEDPKEITPDLEVTPEPVNYPPSISGTPTISISANTDYSFTPIAADEENETLTFSITNKPSWAEFDTTSGKLYGTPVEIQTYTDIRIAVSDGANTSTLLPFDINIIQSSYQVTIQWGKPTENEDGSSLDNIAGYKVLYGAISGIYDNSRYIDDAEESTAIIDNLEAGEYYFSMITVTPTGVESSPSTEFYIEVGQ
jgi:hypothetical protein